MRPRATFARLLRYVRPYVGVLALAVATSAVYAGARTGRMWLLQPLVDDVMLPAQAAGSLDVGGWLGELRERAAGALGGDTADAPVAAEPRQDARAGEAAQQEDVAEVLEPDDQAALRAHVRENLPRVFLAALLIVGILPFAHYGEIFLAQYVLGRVLVDVQQQLCAKLLSLPLRFHQGVSRGETLSRVMNDASRAHLALDLIFADVVQSFLALLVGGAILLTISWQLTLATLVVAPFVAGVIAVFGRRIRKSARRRQESQGELTQRLVQILNGIKVIKSFRGEQREEEAFHRDNARYFRRSMRVVRSRAASRTVVEGLTNTIGVVLILAGALAAAGGLWGLSTGAVVAFTAVMATTYRPLKDLAKGWTQLMEAIPSAERFFELLDEEPEVADAPGAVAIDGVHEGIAVRKVSFSYGREPVLRDVSLGVRAGEVVAIVGRTGSGKSTLADLLLRFYDPQDGAIEVDGVDLRRIPRRSWLDHVAVVSQDPFLFVGSIRDNIRYGRPDAGDHEVEAAARAAHVDEFAKRLPQGLDTDVGEAGARLSGGQRQRITIARAILKDPSVLIFDEATSALDARSERIVQEAIESLLEGRTVFVIAHRLSTVRRADKIVVLEKGRVAELGTHDELLARGGLYAELMALQREGAAG